MSRLLPQPIYDSYTYQSYQRQRQLTLGDLLLENRIVFLQGEIYTGNANEVVMKLPGEAAAVLNRLRECVGLQPVTSEQVRDELQRIEETFRGRTPSAACLPDEEPLGNELLVRHIATQLAR
jgi:hypothetical protein